MKKSPLDDIRIASPCAASWAAMQGDDRKRFCAACKLNVYDLSALSERESLDLIEKAEGRVCVRVWRRADGTVITADCPQGVIAATKRRARRMLAKAALFACVLIGGAAFATSGPGQRLVRKISAWIEEREESSGLRAVKGEAVMGDYCPPTPSAPTVPPNAPVK